MKGRATGPCGSLRRRPGGVRRSSGGWISWRGIVIFAVVWALGAGVRAQEPLDGRSIYRLPGTWLDQDGRSLELRDLAGRAQVVALIYTDCSYACPALLARMKRIETALEEEVAGGFGLTLVSIDPERDRPERLKGFAKHNGLAPERWTLLNGGDEAIRALSVLLDVPYRATGEGDFAHANVITVLDPGGVVVGRVEGLGADLEPALEVALRESRRALRGPGPKR